MLQAWFDDSGKGQEPVYLLAGYLAGKDTWATFSGHWQAELDRPPRLPYLHANESQLFKDLSLTERAARLLRFIEIIGKHRLEAHAFILKHADYNEFFRFISTHPVIAPAERRVLRNPYYISFQRILTMMLARQAKEAEIKESASIEVLFDCGIDRHARLKLAFEHWVKTVERREPTWLKFLINKAAEFRDDKVFLPLQASDLLAWHVRRFCYEAMGNRSHAGDLVWRAPRPAMPDRLLELSGCK